VAAGEQNIHHSDRHNNGKANLERGQAWVRQHWIISVIALLVIAFGLVRIFHHGYAPPEPQNTNGHVSTAFNTETTGPGLKVLGALNKQGYVGQPFQVENVPVQTIVNHHAIWVGETRQSRMLVVLPNGSSVNEAGHGDFVNISGTVQKAPPPEKAKHDWGLDDEGAQTMAEQGVYVQASRVDQQQQPQP
jgi:hypothetical protein